MNRSAGTIAAAADKLRAIVPAKGAYVSEGNFFDQSWQRSFCGANYPRLQAVKAKYDPMGLFLSTTVWVAKNGVPMDSAGPLDAATQA